MVNLLSKALIRARTRRYYARLITLLALVLTLVIGVGALLVLPSFFLARAAADESARYLAALEETVGLKERAGVTKAVGALVERVKTLKDFNTPIMVAYLIDLITGAAPRGITITSFSIDRTGAGGRVVVSGSAATRDALLSFANALKSIKQFSGVALPVSSLARDKDVPFTLSFSYTP